MSAALLVLGLVNVAQAEPATEADRASVIAWAKEVLADPYDLRSTEISDRAKVKGVLVLCVAYNGRNLAGRYSGVVRKPFEIKPDGLVSDERSYRVNTATCYAPEITWRPFPELAGIKQP